ncbi:12 days embryo spinal ganglion cDNA [Cavenderia fasciculata]|uniref:12 days embryo spinal ganglion cDNA n=1 Tax=Cavenderia fasciculata TaxID=261658 RepID=F4PRD8_CACFS|nr:12 days embryo spinal ganglion cDNA [Cavenderia fasciculata]EGG20490.1 12 days embryo spinal ganglion cDNA [Cavenderia fasciculata]|eukprot:XP_004358340.1 12 days embryo spinal ganglion cDNA [Cavenderia fasciculata]
MSEEGKSSIEEAFAWAVKNGDLSNVKTAVEADPKILNKLDANQRGPAHWAADFNQVEVLTYLISKKVNVDQKDKYGITPLLAAVYEGHVESVALLVKSGASVKTEGPDGRTAVEAAESEPIKKALSGK